MRARLSSPGLLVLALAAVAGFDVESAGQAAVAEARAVVQPSHDIEVVSPVGGVIKRVLAKEGDRAASGQALVELDGEVQKAALAISEHRARSTARIEASEANLRVRRAALERQKMLHKRGVASDADLEEAELELRHAESLLTVAKEEQALHQLEVKRDRAMLDRMTIRAPLAGIITRCLQDTGESAEEYQPVMRLVVLDPLHVIAHVAPAVAVRIRAGALAQLELVEQPGARYACRVAMVDPVVDAASSTVRVKLELPNPEHKVMAGSRATVYFDLSRPPTASGAGPGGQERRP